MAAIGGNEVDSFGAISVLVGAEGPLVGGWSSTDAKRHVAFVSTPPVGSIKRNGRLFTSAGALCVSVIDSGMTMRGGIKHNADGVMLVTRDAPSASSYMVRDDLGPLLVSSSGAVHLGGVASYLSLSGTSGNYASTPDAAALDITGNLSLLVYAAATDWTPATTPCFLSKSVATGNQRSYFMLLLASGALRLTTSPDGAATFNFDSTVAPTITDGSPLWVRCDFQADNGAAGKTAKFYTSPDGGTWTQLGTDVTLASTMIIFNSTAEVGVGAQNTGTANPFPGRIYRAQIYNGIYGSGGTLVADFNAAYENPGATSFVSPTGETWTINGTAALE